MEQRVSMVPATGTGKVTQPRRHTPGVLSHPRWEKDHFHLFFSCMVNKYCSYHTLESMIAVT